MSQHTYVKTHFNIGSWADEHIFIEDSPKNYFTFTISTGCFLTASKG